MGHDARALPLCCLEVSKGLTIDGASALHYSTFLLTRRSNRDDSGIMTKPYPACVKVLSEASHSCPDMTSERLLCRGAYSEWYRRQGPFQA